MVTYGERVYRKTQIGVESVHGTGVVPVDVLLGTSFTLEEDRHIILPEEEIGAISRSLRAYSSFQGPVQLNYEGEATFEQILYFLLMGMKGGVTGGAGDAGTPPMYTYTFEPSILSDPAHNSYTIRHGDNVQCYEARYVMARALELRGVVNEPVRLTADMFGQQMVDASFAAGLTIPTVETILASKARMYLDSTWAGKGGTELASALISFAWKLNTGLSPFKTGDANPYMSTHVQDKRTLTLDMLMRFHTTSEAERDNYQAATSQALQIEISGSTIHDAVTKKLTLALWGVWTNWEKLTDREGAVTVAATFESLGDIDNDDEAAVIVENALAAVPS